MVAAFRLDVFDQLQAIEQADSGLLRTMVMRSPAEPTLVYVLVVFESQEKARARESGILGASGSWSEFGQRWGTSWMARPSFSTSTWCGTNLRWRPRPRSNVSHSPRRLPDRFDAALCQFGSDVACEQFLGSTDISHRCIEVREGTTAHERVSLFTGGQFSKWQHGRRDPRGVPRE